MNPYYQDPKVKVYNSNALDALGTLPNGSVNLIVTSPPYYGLRRYSGQPLVFQSANPCQEHKWVVTKTRRQQRTLPPEPKGKRNTHENVDEAGRGKQDDVIVENAMCSACGSWLGFLGNEESPDLFVKHLVQIFRECRRVLNDTGIMFINLGDGYSSGQPGTKPKDLIGIPWMTAFALRSDGWYLRAAPPWEKHNGMPESVSDRPTTTHEYWFMLTKSPQYYWDADAIRKSHLTVTPEELVMVSRAGKKMGNTCTNAKHIKHDVSIGRGGNVSYADPLHTAAYHPSGRNYRTADFFFESLDVIVCEQAKYLQHLIDIRDGQGMLLDQEGLPLALVVNPRGFLGEKYLPNSGIDHFAAFPEELVEPIIKAGSPLQRCSKCHAPWVRIVEKESPIYARSVEGENDDTNNKEPYQQNSPHRERLRVNSNTKYNKESDNTGRLATYRQAQRYDSKFYNIDYGQSLSGFARTGSIKNERDNSRIEAQKLFPNNPYAQKAYIHYIHEHGHTKASIQQAIEYALSKVGQSVDDWKRSCGADNNGGYNGIGHKDYAQSGAQNPSDVKRRILAGMSAKKIVEWKPSCACNANAESGIVLDPFAGTGTSLVAAVKHGRNAIGFDMSEDYCKLMVARIQKDSQGIMQ